MNSLDKTAALVSVYIPTHNRSGILLRALASVFSQTYRPIEILICDDGSSDDTPQVVKQITPPSGITIRYFRNATPRGACHARNVCINEASGEFITGLDDDDLFHPRRIEILMSIYDAQYAGIASGIENIYNEQDFGKLNFTGCLKLDSRIIEKKEMLDANVVGSQLLMPTDKLRSIGGFDETLKAWQDYDAWLRAILAYGPVKFVSSNLYYSDHSSEGPRITTSKNRLIGARQFQKKHEALMTKSQINGFDLNFSLISNEDNGLLWILKKSNYKSWKIWIKLIIRNFSRKTIKNG